MMSISTAMALFATVSAWAGPFEDTLLRDAANIRQAHAELALRVDQMEPGINRAGRYAFAGAELADDRVQILMQHRLLFGQDELPVKAAIAFALNGEHRLPWAVFRTLPVDLRVALLNGYKQHGQGDAVDAFEGGLVDSSALVRSESMRLIGYRPDLRSDAIENGLKGGLTDDDSLVRRFAVRAVAWRGEEWGFESIKPLLSDAAPEVRGAAVRALGQLDKQRARALPEVVALKNDDSPHVARPIKTLFKP